MDRPKLLNSCLIVLDGLPGSGKSTTGEWLTAQLRGHGLNVCWLPETKESHPLWWYDHWNGKEYQTPDFENVPIEKYVQTSLSKWKVFTELMSTSGQQYVAESVFFQNAVAMFLMGGGRPETLVEYAQEVQGITRSIDPVLIYFRQNDADAALRRICAVRGRAFEEELISNMERFPYLQKRELKGLDGVSRLWLNIATITDSLFEVYTLPKLAVDTSAGNWQSYRQQILEFLGLPTHL